MENVKHGLTAKSGQSANDMARSIFISQVDSIATNKADTNSTGQNNPSSEDVKAAPGKRVAFSSFAKAPPTEFKEPADHRRIFIPADCTLEELKAHIRSRGEEPSPKVISMMKKMEEKEKLKKSEEQDKLAKRMELKANLMKTFEEKVETGPCGSTPYTDYNKFLASKDKKMAGHENTHGKFFVPTGAKMYAPANTHGKFVTPNNGKMSGQEDMKEQLLDGEYQSVSKDEAEEEWTMIT